MMTTEIGLVLNLDLPKILLASNIPLVIVVTVASLMTEDIVVFDKIHF